MISRGLVCRFFGGSEKPGSSSDISQSYALHGLTDLWCPQSWWCCFWQNRRLPPYSSLGIVAQFVQQRAMLFLRWFRRTSARSKACCRSYYAIRPDHTSRSRYSNCDRSVEPQAHFSRELDRIWLSRHSNCSRLPESQASLPGDSPEVPRQKPSPFSTYMKKESIQEIIRESVI